MTPPATPPGPQLRLDVGGAIADVIRDRHRDAEIDQFRTTAGKILLHKDIGWLDVAVHDAAVVDVVEGIGNLRQRLEPLRNRRKNNHPSSGQELHREPTLPALVHPDDVRMVELVCNLEFSA